MATARYGARAPGAAQPRQHQFFRDTCDATREAKSANERQLHTGCRHRGVFLTVQRVSKTKADGGGRGEPADTMRPTRMSIFSMSGMAAACEE
jgi:hypothetical protein